MTTDEVAELLVSTFDRRTCVLQYSINAIATFLKFVTAVYGGAERRSVSNCSVFYQYDILKIVKFKYSLH